MKFRCPSTLMAAFTAAFGLGVLLGGPVRFSGPSLYVAATMAPWWVWGIAFLAYAPGLMFTQSRPGHWLVVLSGGVPYAFLVASLIGSLHAYSNAAATGIGVYSVLWLFHIVVGVRMYTDRERRDGWLANRMRTEAEQTERKLRNL